MFGASDEEHLAFARREGRVLFTQDDDFLRLHDSGVEHAGIVYSRQPAAIGDIIYGLVLVVEVLDSEEMKGHLEFI
jgi:hypothetical protein